MSPSSIESWSSWLGAAALAFGVLAAFTAIIAWGFSQKSGKLKDEALDKFKAEARERAAKLENEAAQARLEFAKITRPRFEKFNSDAFRNKLKGKPRRIRVELLFQPEDSDSYMLATAIKGCLNAEGWTTIGPRVIREEDITSDMDKDVPLSIRAGAGLGGASYVAKRDPVFNDEDDPINVLISALVAGRSFPPGTESSMGFNGSQDPLLPDDLVRLVIGPRYHEW